MVSESMHAVHFARRRRRRSDRRGVAIVLVLGFMAISFGLAYSLLRAQASAIQLEDNFRRMAEAREAALSGIAVGIRQIHAADWEGVDTSFANTVATNSGYKVTYTTGDDSLELGDADYEMWPYRVTITSQGYSQDPIDPLAIATSEVQVVVQLIPERVATEPSLWEVARQYTLFQAQDAYSRIAVLTQIEGPTRFQGQLDIFPQSPASDDSREQYLADLEGMRIAGHGDYRPLDTNPRVDYSNQSGSAGALVTVPYLELSPIDTNPASGSLPSVGDYTSYQLYPGGAAYNAGTLEFYTRDVTLEPDPKTNPLGLFYSSSNIRIENNVNLTGSIINSGDIVIDGTNISLQAYDLPSIDGGATPVQLSVIAVGDDLSIDGGAQLTVNGSVACNDRFLAGQTTPSTLVSIFGHFIAGEFYTGRPTGFSKDGSVWDGYLLLFNTQSGASFYEFFPEFLRDVLGKHMEPRFILKPPTTPVTLHWLKSGEPLYAPATPGSGLRWQVVSWNNHPQ